jgi:hypothetical protein
VNSTQGHTPLNKAGSSLELVPEPYVRVSFAYGSPALLNFKNGDFHRSWSGFGTHEMKDFFLPGKVVLTNQASIYVISLQLLFWGLRP